MTKDLRYEIVKRSKLKSSFNKNRYHVNKNLITSNFSNYVRINKIPEVFLNIKHGDLNFTPVYLEYFKKTQKTLMLKNH